VEDAASRGEKIMKCEECGIDYPEHLVQPLESGSFGDPNQVKTTLICSICAYDNHLNPARGFPKGTPPPDHSPKAKSLWRDAKQHRLKLEKQAENERKRGENG
jgi:hypothetical protein